MAGYDANCVVLSGANGSDLSLARKDLMQRGLEEARALKSAMNGRGPWWNAGAAHMNAAFPKSYFDRCGLLSLLEQRRRFQLLCEPPYTEPYVRWCGRRRR